MIYRSSFKSFEPFLVNMGPQHPSAHGVLRLVLEMDGERVVKVDPHIGLLHSSSEKLIEYKSVLQSISYFDSLDYVSMMSQEHVFVLGLEVLFNLKVSPSVSFLSIIFSELTRLLNHLMSVTTHALDVGALTPFLFGFELREKLIEFYESISGSRMHAVYFSVGGLTSDVTFSFLADLHEFCSEFYSYLDEFEELLSSNVIWKNSLVGVGTITSELALTYSVSGVILRSVGIPWDLSKIQPYEMYRDMPFNIPFSKSGDSYDRYALSLREMRESVGIMVFCMSKLMVNEENSKFKFFDLNSCFLQSSRFFFKSSMEELITHFKKYAGYNYLCNIRQKAFVCVEAPKGEMSVYLSFSDQNNFKLFSCKVRSPGLFVCINFCYYFNICLFLTFFYFYFYLMMRLVAFIMGFLYFCYYMFYMWMKYIYVKILAKNFSLFCLVF